MMPGNAGIKELTVCKIAAWFVNLDQTNDCALPQMPRDEQAAALILNESRYKDAMCSEPKTGPELPRGIPPL